MYRTVAGGARSLGRAIPGLHGRRPVFRTPRDLALSYVDPYIDKTGRVTGYAVVDLRMLGDYDWRLSERNIWKVERVLLEWPHRPIRSSDRRVDRLRARYLEFIESFPGCKPTDYRGRRSDGLNCQANSESRRRAGRRRRG